MKNPPLIHHTKDIAHFIHIILYKHYVLVQLDILLGQLLTVCPVDILPGAIDPSNLTLPQQVLSSSQFIYKVHLCFWH